MFREPHARLASELHLTHVHEPTRMDTDEKPPIGYTDHSLDDDAECTTPPLIPVVLSSKMLVVQTEQAAGLTVSPQASYYSSNDIPVPSPIPPPLYRFLNGDVGEKPSRGRRRCQYCRFQSQFTDSFHLQYQRRLRCRFGILIRHPPVQSQSPSPPGPQGSHSAYLVARPHVDETSRPESWMGGRAL